jgi:hypothetical protein
VGHLSAPGEEHEVEKEPANEEEDSEHTDERYGSGRVFAQLCDLFVCQLRTHVISPGFVVIRVGMEY